MMQPRKKYAFKSKLPKVLYIAFGYGSLLSWFAWGNLQSSWFQTQPRTPSPATGHVIPYEDKVIVYVTQRDLDTTHAILAIVAASALLAIVSYLADHKPWRRQNSN
jgi:hypothetical protein